MKGLLRILFFIPLYFFSTFVFSQNRYWVGNSTYLTNFNTTSEINEWSLIEDNGTGAWGLSGSGTATLKMDDASGAYANRIINVNGGSPKLLPLDATNGIVEFNLVSVTGGIQNYFLQVQEFNSSGTYLAQQTLLFGTNTTGYFSVDLSTITWNPATTQIRFIIGGSNYSAQQGVIEFDYFSYTNNNKNWNNASNWSLTSGGIGGATPPGIGDTAIFNGSGTSNGICFLNANTSVGTIRMNGYTGSIDLRGHNLSVANGATFRTGQITNSGSDTTLTLNCTNDAIFSGTTFNVEVNGSVDGLYLNGSTFNSALTISKTGSGLNEGEGGNHFNDSTTITCNNASATLRLATMDNDTFNHDVTFNQTLGILEPAYNNTTAFYANVTCSGTDSIVFGIDTGSTSFLGNSAQSISATSAPTFNRILINKPSNNLILNTPITIGKEATFTSGIINSTVVNDVTFIDSAIASGGNSGSYVDGPVTKIGDDIFSFPIGNNGSYRPLSISAPSSLSSEFRGEYSKSNPGISYNRSSRDVSLDSVSNCEYWLLDRVSGTDDVSVTLTWNDTGSCGMTALTDLSIARWDGAEWKDHGNGGTTGNTSAGSITTSGAVTSFSPFTFGFTPSTPLPIDIISFNASLNADKVHMHWVTASEMNNDYFTIEKSKDGVTWVVVKTHNGAGNSNTILNYSDVDENPYSGISYYRLKQTDFNGGFDYSHVEIISNSNSNNKLNFYPNPVKNILYCPTLTTSDVLTVYDVSGQIIYKGSEGEIYTSSWEKGVYVISISNPLENTRSQQKIVK